MAEKELGNKTGEDFEELGYEFLQQNVDLVLSPKDYSTQA